MSDFYDRAYNNPYHINRHNLIESYYKNLYKSYKSINNFYNINNKNKKNKFPKYSYSYDYFNMSIKNNESNDSSFKIQFLLNKKEDEKNNSFNYLNVNGYCNKFTNINNNNRKISLLKKPIGSDININGNNNLFNKIKKINTDNIYFNKNNNFIYNKNLSDYFNKTKIKLKDNTDYKKNENNNNNSFYKKNDYLNNIMLKNFQKKLKKFDLLKLYIKNTNFLEENLKKNNESNELNQNNNNNLKKSKDKKINSILNNFFSFNSISKNNNDNKKNLSNNKMFYSANTTNQRFFCNKLLNKHSFNSTKNSKNFFNSTRSSKKNINNNKSHNNISSLFNNSIKNDNSVFFNENSSNNEPSEKINLLIPPYTGYEINGQVAIPKKKKLKIKRFYISKELKEKMRCWKMENLKDFGYDAEFIEGMIYSPEDQKKIDELNKKNKENSINDNEKKKGTITIRMGDNNYNKIEEEDEEVEYEEIEEEENENNN